MKITIEYEDGRRIDVDAADRAPVELFRLFERELLISRWNGRHPFEMFSYQEVVDGRMDGTCR
jgi:hypothetical protein